MEQEPTLKMRVGGLTMDPVTKAPIVVLRDDDSKLQLPIWIGLLEATAMVTALEGVKPPRPMTHDLLREMIGTLGGTVESIAITDLRENTYYAEIRLRVGDSTHIVDSRPSDAISLAIRTQSPIFVAKRVIENSALLETDSASVVGDTDLSGIPPDKWSDILDKMSPEDFKYKM